MGAKNGNKERRQMLVLLERIADVAEHSHHTGAFEDGADLSVQRYNRIVKALEASETIPADMFPSLPENASFSRLGAECRLLVGYLEDYHEDAEEDAEDGQNYKQKSKGSGAMDTGMIAALAPFLGEKDLAQLVSAGGEIDAGVLTAIAPFMGQEQLGRVVRQHFPSVQAPNGEEETPDTSQPDLKAVCNMAPFLDKETLTELVRACLARDPNPNPKRFAELAPFLPREVFGELIRTYFPHWFGKAAPTPPMPPSPPAPPAPPELNDRRAVIEAKLDAAPDK